MKKIFGKRAIHILPLASGFIIAVKKQEIDDRSVIGYKMATLQTDLLNSVTRNVYLLAKFGNNFKQIEERLGDSLNCKTILLPGGQVFAAFPDGRALRCDARAEVLWEGELLYRGMGPADIVRQEDCLWASFPESNTIIRYNLSSMREELRIGGSEKGAAFSYPMGLWIEGEDMLVCNAGSNSITEVNLSSFSAFDYAGFEEPVQQYLRVGDTEIVLLESGVYTL